MIQSFSDDSVRLYIIGGGVAVATLFALRTYFTARARLHALPPGPKGIPILGNSLDFGYPSPWLMYDRWFKQYGDVVYVNLIGQPVVFLGSYKAAIDLLEHRGTIYSSRKQSVMGTKIMQCGGLMVRQPYGEDWRRSRKLLHPHVHTNAVSQYHSIQLAAARAFVRELLEAESSPDALPALVWKDFAETINKIVYGIHIKTEQERVDYIDIPTQFLKMLSESATPGRFWVDGLHFLQYVPAWMPGASFQTWGKKARDLHRRACEVPMKFVRAQMAQGIAPPSIVRNMLEEASPEDQLVQDTIRDLGAVAYIAGADTTSALVLAFFIAMLRYPDAQKAGQKEIDGFLGNRLPTFEDRDSLPYVNAIMLETLRWIPAIPGGLPHSTSADDTYKGYFIPKGTLVFGVAWAMLHDPSVYDKPEDFLPERFLRRTPSGVWELDPTVRDPRMISFGFGRRICPGQHLAEQSLFATIATVLAAVDVLPALDENGKDVIPPISLVKGTVSYVQFQELSTIIFRH